MEVMGTCAICSRPAVLFTCTLCGRNVCRRCLAAPGVCVECYRGNRRLNEDEAPGGGHEDGSVDGVDIIGA